VAGSRDTVIRRYPGGCRDPVSLHMHRLRNGKLLRMKLSRYQRELLEAMHAGVRVHYIHHETLMNATAYYFRSDTMKRCTRAAKALLAWGVVEKVECGPDRRHQLRPCTR
jgi:hypothetical protein